MKSSPGSVAVAGAIAVAVVFGLNAWHWYREAADVTAPNDVSMRSPTHVASRGSELLPENPDPATEPGVPVQGDSGTVDTPATVNTETPVASSQEASPLGEYRGVAAPVPPSSVPPDAGNEWQRAFEKEERDETWARPLEAEIQKSLDPEINQGRFYLANVECRATLCEIRLLARGSLQRAELDQFQSTIFQLPWAARLNPALSSGAGGGDRYEAIWIFERRPESPAD